MDGLAHNYLPPSSGKFLPHNKGIANYELHDDVFYIIQETGETTYYFVQVRQGQLHKVSRKDVENSLIRPTS